MPILPKGNHHVVIQDRLWDVKNELEEMKYLLEQHSKNPDCNSNPMAMKRTQKREFIQETERHESRGPGCEHESRRQSGILGN